MHVQKIAHMLCWQHIACWVQAYSKRNSLLYRFGEGRRIVCSDESGGNPQCSNKSGKRVSSRFEMAAGMYMIVGLLAGTELFCCATLFSAKSGVHMWHSKPVRVSLATTTFTACIGMVFVYNPPSTIECEDPSSTDQFYHDPDQWLRYLGPGKKSRTGYGVLLQEATPFLH